MKSGCGRPVLKNNPVEEVVEEKIVVKKQEEMQMVRVGKKAPVFTAPAFYNGEMTEVNLEDYKGKWVLLCFYPGDFTFV